jgi:hypothetical protein
MSQLSRSFVNRLHPNRVLEENVKPAPFPSRGEHEAKHQPRARYVSPRTIANQQRRNDHHRPPLSNWSRPSVSQCLKLFPEVRVVPYAPDYRPSYGGGLSSRDRNVSPVSRDIGSGAIDHQEAPQQPGANLVRDQGFSRSRHSPFHISSRPSVASNGPLEGEFRQLAYPSRAQRQKLPAPSDQQAANYHGDTPAIKRPRSDENQALEPISGYSPHEIPSSDERVPSSGESMAVSSDMPYLYSDVDTIICSPTPPVSLPPPHKPTTRASVSYYDYSEPFHEKITTADFKSPAVYPEHSGTAQRSRYTPPIQNNPDTCIPNSISGQRKWPLKSKSLRYSRAIPPYLQGGGPVFTPFVEPGSGSSLPRTSFRGRSYNSHNPERILDADYQNPGSGNRRPSRTSLRLDFSFPRQSGNIDYETHRLDLNSHSNHSNFAQAAFHSVPIESTVCAEQQKVLSAFSPTTRHARAKELVDCVLVQQSHIDSAEAAVINPLDTEYQIRTDSTNSSVTSVPNARESANFMAKSEPKAELVELEHQEAPNHLGPILYNSLSSTQHQPPGQCIYLEKETQTCSYTSTLSVVSIEKGTDPKPGKETGSNPEVP